MIRDASIFLSRFGDRAANLVSWQSGDRHLGSIVHSRDVALIFFDGSYR